MMTSQVCICSELLRPRTQLVLEQLVPSTFKFLDTQLQVNEDAAYAVGTILRLEGTRGSASVAVYSNTEGGNTATEDVAYTASNETIIFGDGEFQKIIQVSIPDDGACERLEHFSLYLTNGARRGLLTMWHDAPSV